MDYLNQVLGIRVQYLKESEAYPLYIQSQYRVQRAALDGKEVLFLYPKKELASVSAIKKHFAAVQKVSTVPAVLVPPHLTYRQKEYLLRARIPFVVEGKQIYLPFYAVYLQERGEAEKIGTEAMLPSAQVLLLYYIYRGANDLKTSAAAGDLGFTPTSISRASRQLEEMGLIKLEKVGVQKIITGNTSAKELFEKAGEYFCDPVKRVIYVPKEKMDTRKPLSGYSALAKYTMLNAPAVKTYAAESIAVWESSSTKKLQSSEEQVRVELWRYDPRKLTKGAAVDRLSLALALRKDADERVEEEVEHMLNEVWEEIDGSGN